MAVYLVKVVSVKEIIVDSFSLQRKLDMPISSLFVRRKNDYVLYIKGLLTYLSMIVEIQNK